MATVVTIIAVLAPSTKNWEEAAKNALNEANNSLRYIRTLYIMEFEASFEDGELVQCRITQRVPSKSNRSIGPVPESFCHGTN
jgi:dodecin